MEKKIEKFMEEQKEKEKKPSFFSRIWNHSTIFHGTECRTIFLPLCVVDILLDEQRVKYIQSIPWSEARAKRYLDKWFCHIFKYSEKHGFSYCSDWHSSAVRPRALFRPWHWCERMFEEKYRSKIIEYIFDKYTVEGLKKTVEEDEEFLDCYDNPIRWVNFKKDA